MSMINAEVVQRGRDRLWNVKAEHEEMRVELQGVRVRQYRQGRLVFLTSDGTPVTVDEDHIVEYTIIKQKGDT